MIEIGSSDCKFEDEIRRIVKLTRYRHGYVGGGGINQHWVEVDPKDGNNIGFQIGGRKGSHRAIEDIMFKDVGKDEDVDVMIDDNGEDGYEDNVEGNCEDVDENEELAHW